LTNFHKFNLHSFLDKIWWQIMQSSLTGFGGISYEFIAQKEGFKNFTDELNEVSIGEYVSTGGTVVEVRIKNSPKVGDFAIMKLNCNNKENSILIWNETFEIYKESILESENKLLILNGQVKFDNYANQNNLQTNRNTKLFII